MSSLLLAFSKPFDFLCKFLDVMASKLNVTIIYPFPSPLSIVYKIFVPASVPINLGKLWGI